MIKYFSFFLFCVFLVSCQSPPTVLTNEVAPEGAQIEIILDVRPALNKAGFAIPGSASVESADFLILKPGSNSKRILDPDSPQIIERLARRGLHPFKKITIVYQDLIEAKKWKWLLSEASFKKISLIPFDEYISKYAPLRPKAALDRVEVWNPQFKADFFKKSETCFVNWSDEKCLD